ncbi:ABC transporter permease [Streptomyces boluensis]|uniref:ABC transporter permease n=1 Tax=Streptomyces boluensis TaxID=1775135 RepID=A0A964XKS9_9ACTN|nr:ABC transporter permease [Streptomyces boluensis]NBE51381.1 ABC transporter permease [Streptomyces boluensis]
MNTIRTWARDLGLGVRFAVSGGPEGWVRTVLTAIGVGCGVALLLATTAVPGALDARSARSDARTDVLFSSEPMARSDRTLVVAHTDTEFRGADIRGRVYQPEGPDTPLPPGVSAYPKPGEVLVSPALKRLLDSGDSALLRERIDAKVVGTLGDDALLGPHDLVYYKGADDLKPSAYPVERIDAFGTDQPEEGMDPVLLLLTLVVFVVLLIPVAVFIAAAVRFGGERRDRRLAALRLIGADSRTARRIAAGEALAGSVFGLAVGAGLFLVVRQFTARVDLFRVSVFPHDLDPSPALALLVAVTVPAAAVAVTLFALRRVVIEPLGVVRTSAPRRRRLWWRLLLPLAGAGLLAPMIGQGDSNGNFNQFMVTGGVVLLLVGITVLLPWLVEATVARLGGGGLSWQLAVRRLQLSSGTAARTVSGIAVAVAGAIALQMLFAGVDNDYTRSTGEDANRAQMYLSLPPATDTPRQLKATADELARTEGVTRTTPPRTTMEAGERKADPEESMTVTVGSCAALREVAQLPSCRDGDAFVATDTPYDTSTPKLAKSGRTVYLDPAYDTFEGAAVPMRVPADLREAKPRKDPLGDNTGGLLLTPKAFPAGTAVPQRGELFVRLDPSAPDAAEYVRNVATHAGPVIEARTLQSSRQSDRFAQIRNGLFIGAVCVLLLIGASLLVSQLEQLRERKKLLSALVAFGTRRRTLSLSVFWQTAVPVGLGLVLSCVVGLALGSVLLKMVGQKVTVDWAAVAGMTGAGAAVVLLVTLLSLPPLLRLMRPDGLRTE